jgi:drug/metabolite transporter (DMT)-like permease
VRRIAGNIFVEHRGWVELVAVALSVAGYLLVTGDDQFVDTLTIARRGEMYSSLAGTAGALLGFTLAALSILVALPSSDRLDILKKHHSWPRVISSYFRAASALGLALVLCSLGIPLDSGSEPWVAYEVVVIAVLVFAAVQAVTAVVALDQIVHVARQKKPVGRTMPADKGP